MNTEPRAFPKTNTAQARAFRLALCNQVANSGLSPFPENRYPEAHAALRKILAGQRVSDSEVEWAWGVVNGVNRCRS